MDEIGKRLLRFPAKHNILEEKVLHLFFLLYINDCVSLETSIRKKGDFELQEVKAEASCKSENTQSLFANLNYIFLINNARKQ